MCPTIDESFTHFIKVQFLTKHEQLSESKIGIGSVNIQHRATDETLDPLIRSSVYKSQSVFVMKHDPQRIGPGTSWRRECNLPVPGSVVKSPLGRGLQAYMVIVLDSWNKRSGCSQIPPFQEHSEADYSELDVEFSDIQAVGLCHDR